MLLAAQRTRAALAGLAVALGYAAAHAVLLGLPELAPVAAVERMPWIVLGFGVLVTVGGSRPGSLGEAALLLVVLVAAWWITESARAHAFAGSLGGVLVCGLALAACAARQFVRVLTKEAPAWGPPLVVALAAGLLAPALVMGRSAVLGQLCGALCSVCLVGALLGRGERSREVAAFLAGAAAPIVSFLAACGWLYAYLDSSAAACLGIAPLAAAVGLRREESWSAARGLGALLLLGAVGLWLAYLGIPEPSPYDY